MTTKRLALALAALLLLAAAFWGIDFRAAVSQTNLDHTISTSQSTPEGADPLPANMAQGQPVLLSVPGEDPLAAALRTALTEQMSQAGFAQFSTDAAAQTGAALQVNVGQPDVRWTPFFGWSSFTVQTGFASDGDLSFLNQQVTYYDGKNGTQMHSKGSYTLQDRSWGLISRPGYYHFLADELAQKIIASLRDLYTPKP